MNLLAVGCEVAVPKILTIETGDAKVTKAVTTVAAEDVVLAVDPALEDVVSQDVDVVVAVVSLMVDVVVADEDFVAVINVLTANEDWTVVRSVLSIFKAITNGVNVLSIPTAVITRTRSIRDAVALQVNNNSQQVRLTMLISSTILHRFIHQRQCRQVSSIR